MPQTHALSLSLSLSLSHPCTSPSFDDFPSVILQRSLSRLPSVVHVTFLGEGEQLCLLHCRDYSGLRDRILLHLCSQAAVCFELLDFSNCCHSHSPTFGIEIQERSGAKVLGRHHQELAALQRFSTWLLAYSSNSTLPCYLTPSALLIHSCSCSGIGTSQEQIQEAGDSSRGTNAKFSCSYFLHLRRNLLLDASYNPFLFFFLPAEVTLKEIERQEKAKMQ